MGRSTDCDVVPFAVHDIFYTHSWPQEHDSQMLCVDGDEDLEPTNGWTPGEICKIGKKNLIYATVWTKRDLKAYIVNESEYSNGGEYCLALIADSKEAIKEFISDWKIDITEIEENEAVQQTL